MPLHWDSSRTNFLSKAEQNLKIFKGFLSTAGQTNSKTGNHTPLQEHTYTSMLALHCSEECQLQSPFGMVVKLEH